MTTYPHSASVQKQTLKPDIVKLDRAVVQNCDQDHARLAIGASIIRLGTEIGITVVAEGVERIEEVDALRSVRVKFIQGFYFC